MRIPRDFDAELKALNDKARQLKERKVHQLGELVIASGADSLPIEQLAGSLLAAAETKDTATREAWHKRGAAFFQRSVGNADGARRDAGSVGQNDGGAASAGSKPGTN